MSNLETAPTWMTIANAASIANVCDKTIRRWCAAGLLRYSQPAGRGGRVLISRDSLRALIERSAQGPVAPAHSAPSLAALSNAARNLGA